MKTVFIAISMLVMATLHASEIKIEELNESPQNGLYTVSQVFEVNKDLGRAWVKIGILDTDAESLPYEYRVKVEGLSYDIESSEIRFEQDGSVVTCATNYIRGPRFFRSRSIRMTGNCTFERRVHTVMIDNGFELKKTKILTLFLVTK